MAWPECDCIGCVYREIAQHLWVGLFSAWREWPERNEESYWVMVVRQPSYRPQHPIPTGTILERRFLDLTPYRNCGMAPDGTVLSREDFPELYRIIGERYGGSKGGFKIPDMRARVPLVQFPNTKEQ